MSGPLLCFTASSKPVKATNQDLPEKQNTNSLYCRRVIITFKGQKRDLLELYFWFVVRHHVVLGTKLRSFSF